MHTPHKEGEDKQEETKASMLIELIFLLRKTSSQSSLKVQNGCWHKIQFIPPCLFSPLGEIDVDNRFLWRKPWFHNNMEEDLGPLPRLSSLSRALPFSGTVVHVKTLLGTRKPKMLRNRRIHVVDLIINCVYILNGIFFEFCQMENDIYGKKRKLKYRSFKEKKWLLEHLFAIQM